MSVIERNEVMSTYLVLCYRNGDIPNVIRQLTAAGVVWYEYHEIPFRNRWGDVMGSQYAFLYQHTTEIPIEVQN
jgi:hypothetical protein